MKIFLGVIKRSHLHFGMVLQTTLVEAVARIAIKLNILSLL